MKNIYKITYKDSNIMNDQSSEVVKPANIIAVGFVLEHKSTHITLARELVDDEYRGQISIPIESIEEIVKVKGDEEPEKMSEKDRELVNDVKNEPSVKEWRQENE